MTPAIERAARGATNPMALDDEWLNKVHQVKGSIGWLMDGVTPAEIDVVAKALMEQEFSPCRCSGCWDTKRKLARVAVTALRDAFVGNRP